jgi:hypothetical protein
MGESCSTFEERKSVYKVLVEKHEGRRPLGRPRLDERIIWNRRA